MKLREIAASFIQPEMEDIMTLQQKKERAIRLKPQFPDLSLGTVYRNLAAFKAEGVIDSVGVVNGLERYDGNTIPHAHIVCESCGAVLDAETIELSGELLAHVQQDTGCAIRRYQISFTGVCPNCLQKH